MFLKAHKEGGELERIKVKKKRRNPNKDSTGASRNLTNDLELMSIFVRTFSSFSFYVFIPTAVAA